MIAHRAITYFDLDIDLSFQMNDDGSIIDHWIDNKVIHNLVYCKNPDDDALAIQEMIEDKYKEVLIEPCNSF